MHASSVPVTQYGAVLPAPVTILNKELVRVREADDAHAEQKKVKVKKGYAYDTYSKKAKWDFFIINIMQDIKTSSDHAKLFTDPNLIDIFDEKHYRNGIVLPKNYFLQLMENLYKLKVAITKVNLKAKKARPFLQEAPKDNDTSHQIQIFNGIMGNNHSHANSVEGLADGTANETTVTTLTVSSHTLIISPKPRRSPKIKKVLFDYDFHKILLNSATLTDEIARAHCNAMARRNANSFQYEQRMFALSTTLRAATELIVDLARSEKCDNLPEKSKELSASLRRLQNSLENPASRILRENPLLATFMWGMTTLAGLAMIVGGVILSPLNPIAGLHLIIAGGCVSTTGLAGWLWSPLVNLVAPDPDFTAVKQTSTLTVESFNDLISSSATFFFKSEFRTVSSRVSRPLMRVRF
jgi:hypothetical protein